MEFIAIDIEQSVTNACGNGQTNATLNLTNSYWGAASGGSVTWTSSPAGLSPPSGSGDTFTFNPSNSVATTYVVTAYSDLLTNCYDTCTVRIIKVEFDNVWERNLDSLPGGMFPDYEKCIAIEHEGNPNNKVDLLDFLKIEPVGVTFDEIKAFVDFNVDLQIFDTAIVVSDSDLEDDAGAPGGTDIYAFGLELRCNGAVVDRLIVVIYPPSTATGFAAWQTANPNTAWTATLPHVYSGLNPAPNRDPEPAACNPQEWEGVGPPAANYHYNAAFEMRSDVAGWPVDLPGHQACYDAAGVLIEDDGVGDQVEERRAATGTADRDAPRIGHPDADVIPFIRAAHLDGNPVDGVGVFNATLSHVLIRLGDNLDDYYNRRPPLTANQGAAGSCVPGVQ